MSKKAKMVEAVLDGDGSGQALPPVALDEVETRNLKLETGDTGELKEIALSLIDQSPYQVRVVDTESESFKELVVSVCEQGLINPMTVRWCLDTGRYELIAGHRRFRACEVVGKLTAPCYVLSVSDAKAEGMTACENLNREDLLPIDEALTVKAMIDHGRSRNEISKITGKSIRWVYRREAAARLEDSWIDRARTSTLSSRFLEFAAALDQATREQILSNQFDGALWENGGNLAMLEKLSLVAQRNLNAAPWMGVSPEECNACLKRTDTNELIMDESCCCLDAECWKRHMDELADRTEAKCKEKGIAVKRVTEETLMEMDVEESRSAEYDTCVLSTTEQGAVEVYWGRSQPKAAALQKKAAIKKPSAQNISEMAFAGEVLRRIETLATSGTDLQGFLACCLMVGLDLSAFRPKGLKGFVCDERTKGIKDWLSCMYMNATGKEGIDNQVDMAFQDCVMMELRNRLQCRNPLDTVSQYTLAVSVMVAFNLDAEEVNAAADATVKSAKKRK